MPGYKMGKLIASEDFSNNLDNWFSEGNIISRIDSGRLYLESYHPEIENPKGNLWWKHEFENPYVIEFDFQSLSDEGLAMVFWNAIGLDGKDVFTWERTGKYTEYINSNLVAYHVSFHRFNSGLSNIRKAPGFHLVSSEKDPIATNDRNVHRIIIASAKNRIRIFADGKLIHNFTDERKPCLNKDDWQHPLPCKGTGIVPNSGVLSFRLILKQKAYFDNINVYELRKVYLNQSSK